MIPYELRRRIDEMCDRFEADWNRARESSRDNVNLPKIEFYIENWPSPDRSALIVELVMIEMELCNRDGTSPDLLDYLRRFPECAVAITRRLKPAPPTPGFDTDVSGDSLTRRDVTESPPAARPIQSDEFPELNATSTRFEVVRWQARGGLGEVFVGRDTAFDREVAIKTIRSDLTRTSQLDERFLFEARVTARLQHPSIVSVYGVGVTCDGKPYYAMRYIEGESLRDAVGRLHTDYSAQSSQNSVVTLRTLLASFCQACRAVGYAHSCGVIHRDLKPHNIMLGAFGETQVVDWGLAKDTRSVMLDARAMESDDSDAEQVGNTRFGEVLGTIGYISPEQMAGCSNELGPTTDVYSLGATLFCILTGDTTKNSGLADGQITEDWVRSRIRIAGLDSLQHRGIASICAKAMAFEKRDRYQSAQDVASDIEQWLAGEPVSTCSESPWDRYSRWARRNRRFVQVVIASLVAAVLLSVAGTILINQQKKIALATTRDSSRLLYAANMKVAEAAWSHRNVRLVHDILGKMSRPLPELGDYRGWEWYFLNSLCHHETRTFGLHRTGASCVQFSHDGTWLATGASDGTVRIWDYRTGNEHCALPKFGAEVLSLAFSTSAQQLAVASRDGSVSIWDLSTTPRLVQRFEVGKQVYAAAIAPGLDHVAVRLGLESQSEVHVWNVSSMSLRATLSGHTAAIKSLAFDSGGTRLVTGAEDASVRLWDVSKGTELSRFAYKFHQRVRSVAISPNGQIVAAGGDDGHIALWDLTDRAEDSELVLLASSTANRINFSSQSNQIAAATDDKSVQIWDVASGKLLRTLEGHAYSIKDVAWTSDGQMLASACEDETVRLWNATGSLSVSSKALPARLARNLSFSADGRKVAWLDPEGTVVIWSTADWQEIQRVVGSDGVSSNLAFDGQRLRLATCRGEQEILLWNLSISDAPKVLTPVGRISEIEFSPDGRWLASATHDGRIDLWNATTGELIRQVARRTSLNDRVYGLKFSPDSTKLASCGMGARLPIVVYDVTDGHVVHQLDGLRDRCYAVSFNSKGNLLACGDRYGTIKVWDMMTGADVATYVGHSDRVFSLCFAPDDSRIVSCGRDGFVRLWDPITAREVFAFRTKDTPEGVWFPRDGAAIVTRSKNNEIEWWESPQPR